MCFWDTLMCIPIVWQWCDHSTAMTLILWTQLSLNIFATISRIHTGFSSLDLVCKINGENPVQIWCVVSEKSAQKSVHRISAYTVGPCVEWLRTVCTIWPDISSLFFIVWCHAIGLRNVQAGGGRRFPSHYVWCLGHAQYILWAMDPDKRFFTFVGGKKIKIKKTKLS